MIACFLGREHVLCTEELLSSISSRPLPHLSTDEIVIFDNLTQTEQELIATRLSGVVKMAQLSEKADQQTFVETALKRLAERGEGKVPFGISVYNAGNEALFGTLKGQRVQLGKEIKQRAKDAGMSARYVDSREPVLNSVALHTEKILRRGVEWVLLATKEGLLVGETLFVQDFRAWGDRDFGRPARDAASGMLPPKLARLLVNLASSNKPVSSVWDPFCGSGTVLMESQLLGVPTLIGSDLSEKAIEDTKMNLAWLAERFSVQNRPSVTLSQADVLTFAPPHPVDAIVFEGFLGPRHLPEDPEEIAVELENFYQKTFRHLAQHVVSGGFIVAAIPVFVTPDAQYFLSLAEIFEASGLTPEWVATDLHPEFTHNEGRLYGRPDQRVWREILRLRRI